MEVIGTVANVSSGRQYQIHTFRQGQKKYTGEEKAQGSPNELRVDPVVNETHHAYLKGVYIYKSRNNPNDENRIRKNKTRPISS